METRICQTVDQEFSGNMKTESMYHFLLDQGTTYDQLQNNLLSARCLPYSMYRSDEIDDDVDVCMSESNYSIQSCDTDSETSIKKIRPRNYKCKVCQKGFSQSVNLFTHERIHSGERPYRCEICFKTFTQQPNLVKHVRIHTGEKPYNCATCDKSFTQQANLMKHVRIHTGERPYICKVCKKSFTQQANLDKHNRLHTGERPFNCRYCEKTFTQQANVDRHERIHTGRKPYTCKICWKTFAQNGNLVKHQMSHHDVGSKNKLRKVLNYQHHHGIEAKS